MWENWSYQQLLRCEKNIECTVLFMCYKTVTPDILLRRVGIKL